MPRRTVQGNPQSLRTDLSGILENFELLLESGTLREQVCELVQAHYSLRDLGASLPTFDGYTSAASRILRYLQNHVGEVIRGDELMVVAGISEYGRRVRELRVQEGWSIITGVAVSEMRRNANEENSEELSDLPEMQSDDYLLQSAVQDRDAAFRWHRANTIRRQEISVKNKILIYLRENVSKSISGEELRYLANNRSEWARRVRELRTEEGWPISTKSNGQPDLPVGVYVLEEDKQSPPHDRSIPDRVRRRVLQRDQHKCQRQECGWHHGQWNQSDPRHLEVHHITAHAEGGENTAENLVTYCNICHDEVHQLEGTAQT